jgi:two-component system, response regulator
LEEDYVDKLDDVAKTHIRRVRVVIARDGVEALDYLFATGAHAGRDMRIMPHVVLLDLKLPKVSGLEVLKALRGDPRTRLLPVVILTSSNEERDRIEGYGLAQIAMCGSPCNSEILLKP